MPSIVTVAYTPVPGSPDAQATTEEFEAQLQQMGQDRRGLADNHAVIAYESQQVRRQSIEIKAAAAIALATVIATGAAIVITLGGEGSRYVVIPAIIYITVGVVNATRVLVPRMSWTFTPSSAVAATPTADLLAAAELERAALLIASNRTTGAIYDLARAGSWLLIALIVAIA